MVKPDRHVVSGNVPQHTPFRFLWASSQILVFAESLLKCDNEPNTKSRQDAVIQACAGVEVMSQGPREGDHLANGRVEMAVRGVKRQRRPLQISVGQRTSVRIADDRQSPLHGSFSQCFPQRR